MVGRTGWEVPREGLTQSHTRPKHLLSVPSMILEFLLVGIPSPPPNIGGAEILTDFLLRQILLLRSI